MEIILLLETRKIVSLSLIQKSITAIPFRLTYMPSSLSWGMTKAERTKKMGGV